MTYVAQQIASSVVHRRHGLDPLHFVFLMRHLSHAFFTRLRILITGSSIDIESTRRIHGLGFGELAFPLLVKVQQSVARSRLGDEICTVFYGATMLCRSARAKVQEERPSSLGVPAFLMTALTSSPIKCQSLTLCAHGAG